MLKVCCCKNSNVHTWHFLHIGIFWFTPEWDQFGSIFLLEKNCGKLGALCKKDFKGE